MLDDLKFFIRAGRAASLSEAARALGVTPAAASATVKRLESSLGVKLFIRSTRNLRLTTDGLDFLTQCEQGLEIITNACESLTAGQDLIRGQVQLSMPSDLGRNLVLGWLYEFRQLHPNIDLRLQVSDHLADLYREQVDVALRYGEPLDSSLVALPVMPNNRRILCAAPHYLRTYGIPKTPLDLKSHNCLCFMLSDRSHNKWSFSRNNENITVHVKGSVQCDDGEVVHGLARMGEGIAYKSRLDVVEDLRRGTLVQFCSEWLGESAPLYLTCAHRSQLRPVVRLLREFLVERLNAVSLVTNNQ